LAVVVRMDVDEAGGHERPGSIDLALALARHRAHVDDATARYRDVGGAGRCTCAVDDGSTPYDEIVLGHRERLPLGALSAGSSVLAYSSKSPRRSTVSGSNSHCSVRPRTVPTKSAAWRAGSIPVRTVPAAWPARTQRSTSARMWRCSSAKRGRSPGSGPSASNSNAYKARTSAGARSTASA